MSKLLERSEQRKQQAAHERRVAEMRPSLDTRAPAVPAGAHLARNPKREQQLEGASRLPARTQHARARARARACACAS